MKEFTLKVWTLFSGGGRNPGELALLALLNAFLWIYLAAAPLGVLLARPGLEIIALPFWLAFLGLSALAFLSFLSPAAPKAFILPLLVSIPLGIALSIPLLFLLDMDQGKLGMALGGGQLFVGLLSLIHVRIRCGSWFLQAKDLNERKFSIAYLLRFAGGSAAFACLALAGLFGMAMFSVQHFSSSFVRLTPLSLQLGCKNLEKDGKRVVLCGMAHVAGKSFYDSLNARFPARNSIILAEGVSDKKRLVKAENTRYEGIAERLGLTKQPLKLSETIATKNADVDMADLSPDAVAMLNLIFGFHSAIGKKMSALELLNRYSEMERGIEKLMDGGGQEKVMRLLEEEIVMKRNKHLFGEAMAALDNYDNIIIPWGVWHMPWLERMFEEKGFKCEGVDYSSLF